MDQIGPDKNGPEQKRSQNQNGPEVVHNPFYNLFEFNLFLS